MYIIISKKHIIISSIIILIITLSTFFTFAIENEKEGAQLTVLMYHAIGDSKSNKYIVTKEQLEKDFIYIKENGYTTINAEQLISRQFPDKPILLTFDDGDIGEYKYLFPLLKKYQFYAIVNIVGEYAEKGTNNYMNWEQIKEMADSGLVDIGNHTWSLHNLKKRNGVLRKKKENLEEYSKMLSYDIAIFQQKLKELDIKDYGIFAYPFGAWNKDSAELINNMNFKVIMCCYEKKNYINNIANESIYKLNRYNRSGNKKIESILD